MSKQVLVVIGTGGMGMAIARRLGSGRTVVLADARPSALDEAATALRGEGHEVEQQLVDVSDAPTVSALASAAAELGPVTHVAHTAGLSPQQAPTEAILKVDLLGVALVLDAFGEVVAPGGAGVVVASMAGHMIGEVPAEQTAALRSTPAAELLDLPFLAPEEVGEPASAYVLAKHANLLRVQAAAGAWGKRGARVNSLSPGVISTPMGQEELAGESGETMRGLIGMSATGRVGTPDDIAAAVDFLLGPGAGFVTGTDLLIDGGVVAALYAG